MTNPTIEIDLGDILKEIKYDQKAILKEISDIKKEIKSDQQAIAEEISNLKVGQARLDEKVNNLVKDNKELKESSKELKKAQEALAADVADLKGAKSLIIPIVVAVTTAILTLVARTIPFG